MKAITGTVVDGRIEVPQGFTADGAQVVILALGSGEPILLSPEEESELWQAMEDIRRGDYVDGVALLTELRSLQR